MSNAFGTALSSNAFLDIIDLAEALDATNLVWWNSGPSHWIPSQDMVQMGDASATTGPLTYPDWAALTAAISTWL